MLISTLYLLLLLKDMERNNNTIIQNNATVGNATVGNLTVENFTKDNWLHWFLGFSDAVAFKYTLKKEY